MPVPRQRALIAAATATLLGVSVVAASAPATADPDQRPGEAGEGGRADRGVTVIENVPVGSKLDGVRIHGSRDGLSREARRATPETFTARATSAPRAAYQMPFRCGEAWVGTTRSSHSPSTLSVDWNRTDDFDKPVLASAAGTVTLARTLTGSYGKYVVIDHGNGESTLYAHLNSYGVGVGQRVDRGQQIGRLGTTGNSSGPHLHYEQRRNGSVIHPYFDGRKFSFNTTLTSKNCAAAPPPAPKPVSRDLPLAADVVGDSADDPTRWRRLPSARFETRLTKDSFRTITMGTETDQPVLGDWEGRGKASPGVFDPRTRTFRLRSPAGRQQFTFGYAGNIAISGDWDGDGRDEVGVWRPGITRFDMRGRNGGLVRKVTFGEADHLPIIGDWNGDGMDDVGTYDRATRTFTIRYPMGRTKKFVFGPVQGLPMAGDWDGDGISEIGAWNPRTGAFSRYRG